MLFHAYLRSCSEALTVQCIGTISILARGTNTACLVSLATIGSSKGSLASTIACIQTTSCVLILQSKVADVTILSVSATACQVQLALLGKQECNPGRAYAHRHCALPADLSTVLPCLRSFSFAQPCSEGFCLPWVSQSCEPVQLPELLPQRACGPLPPAEPLAVLGWLGSCTVMPGQQASFKCQ